MDEVKVNKVYRHFKGNYYYVENIAYDSETMERMVVYRVLYPTNESINLYVRPEQMFLEAISSRPDNITGQSHRFELVTKIDKNYIK